MEQPNLDFEKQSLLNQIWEYALKIANRDKIITEQKIEINELKEELEELRQQQINEMDNAK